VRKEYHIDRVIFSRFRDIAVWNLTSRAPPPDPLRPLRKRKIAYKAERSFSVRKSFVTFRKTDIVRVIARTTSILRKSTLVVGKCLDVRRTLRIRVFSSRRRTLIILTFTSCVLFAESTSGVERHSAPSALSATRRIRARVLLLELMSWREELSLKKAENRRCRLLLLSLPLGKPFVASYWCTSRIYCDCKPVLDLPIAFP